ncbi:hypothetical protein B0H67DRAFT_138292 [Lasiosphaeris hirsuta]|uniref:Uncharacterized protein n=1 Tax=Lasiosphaeris hirsuta TaxID=260670 RepID=A0AA40E6E8_9PEZI|nr:hypothetical protein B0H67DRAFT_138292 [Lasiosphaeris hirsuta]
MVNRKRLYDTLTKTIAYFLPSKMPLGKMWKMGSEELCLGGGSFAKTSLRLHSLRPSTQARRRHGLSPKRSTKNLGPGRNPDYGWNFVAWGLPGGLLLAQHICVSRGGGSLLPLQQPDSIYPTAATVDSHRLSAAKVSVQIWPGCLFLPLRSFFPFILQYISLRRGLSPVTLYSGRAGRLGGVTLLRTARPVLRTWYLATSRPLAAHAMTDCPAKNVYTVDTATEVEPFR